MAKESQKPPYEERAVAPKVFPTAISLHKVVSPCSRKHKSPESDIPHASKQLDETTVTKGESDDNVRRSNAVGTQVDERQDESGKGKGTKTQGGRVGELSLLGALVETGLEFTTKGRKPDRVGSVGARERVAAVVVGLSDDGILGSLLDLRLCIVVLGELGVVDHVTAHAAHVGVVATLGAVILLAGDDVLRGRHCVVGLY